MSHRQLLIAATLLCLTATSQAATIYRCGAAGNVYSDQPCIDGRVVAANDARSELQRAEGMRIAAYERRLANELQRERLMQEATASRPAANLGARPHPVTVRVVEAPRHKKSGKRKALAQTGRETEFVAYAPASLKSARR